MPEGGGNISVVGSLLIALIVIMASTIQECVHKVEEGHLGLYWRFGKLTSHISTPGFHYLLPYTTKFEQVPVGMQTERVTNIPCGTSGGVMLLFPKIEIVYRTNVHLLLDMVHNYSLDYRQLWVNEPVAHVMNEMCTTLSLHEIFITKFAEMDETLSAQLQMKLDVWCPGLQIVNVRLTKPSIPPDIQKHFETLSNIASELKVQVERQKNTLRTAEKDRTLEKMMAEKEAAVATMHYQRLHSDAERQVAISNVTTATEVATFREHANAMCYGKLQEAKANIQRITPEFLAFQRTQSLRNTDFYYGNRLPTAVSSDGSTLDDAAAMTVLRESSRGSVS